MALAVRTWRSSTIAKRRPTNRDDILEKFSDQLDRRTAAGLTAFPRKPLIVECAIAEQGESKAVRFIMIVVHLKAFGDAQSRARRQLASSILIDMIRQIREVENLPVVLGGDFNDKYHSDSLGPIADTPDLLTLTADDATTDAISYVGLSHRSLIDHVVVSGDVNPDSCATSWGTTRRSCARPPDQRFRGRGLRSCTGRFPHGLSRDGINASHRWGRRPGNPEGSGGNGAGRKSKNRCPP
ncbi:MAG: hypothetical protein U1D30_24210 [Planctomycetota bacterium]